MDSNRCQQKPIPQSLDKQYQWPLVDTVITAGELVAVLKGAVGAIRYTS